MIRHPLPHPALFYRPLSVLLLFLLLIVGCNTTGGTGSQTVQQTSSQVVAPPPPPSIPAPVLSLKQAQDLFNDAVRSDQPTVNTSSAARQKYQQVVELVEQKVLKQADDSGKVSAYALIAFSQWRLGNYARAMQAGEAGRHLYETTKLDSNRRDYGMLLLAGGLSVASQTYQVYLNLQVAPTQEQAQKLTGSLEQAMRAIDSGNLYVGPQEPITIYADLWQLALVDAAVRIWTGLPKEVSQPEVCRWLGRAEPVLAKIPATGNPWQNLTVTYKNKFAQKKKADCPGQ